MDNQHCTECGRLISYGLRLGDMMFCSDECAERFGLDPRECFYGDMADTSDYDISNHEDYY